MTTDNLQVECPNGCSKKTPQQLLTTICLVCNSTGFADQDKAAEHVKIMEKEKLFAHIYWEKTPCLKEIENYIEADPSDSIRINFLR